MTAKPGRSAIQQAIVLNGTEALAESGHYARVQQVLTSEDCPGFRAQTSGAEKAILRVAIEGNVIAGQRETILRHWEAVAGDFIPGIFPRDQKERDDVISTKYNRLTYSFVRTQMSDMLKPLWPFLMTAHFRQALSRRGDVEIAYNDSRYSQKLDYRLWLK